MTKSHAAAFFAIAIFGGQGFSSVMHRLMVFLFSKDLLRFSAWAVFFYLLCIWFYEEFQRQYKIRDEERAAVLKHERKKQSVILSRHPLLESPEDPHGIRSMDELGYYFNEHEDDVAGMDYDRDGRYIFADHKYIRG